MWQRNKWFFAAGAAVLAVVFLACSGTGFRLSRPAQAQAGATPVQDRFALEEGGRIYARYCRPCHGESGRGDGRFYASSLNPAPPDFTDTAFRNSHPERQLRQVIIGGSAAAGKSDLCPAWGKTFSPTEVDYLIAHIQQLRQSKQSAGDSPWR